MTLLASTRKRQESPAIIPTLGAICGFACMTLAAEPGFAEERSVPVVAEVYIREHPEAAGKSRQRILIDSLPGGDGLAAYRMGNGDGGEQRGAELWRFTDMGLGKVHGGARIALSNADDGHGGTEWAVIAGGGHAPGGGEAALFVLFVDRGMDGWTSGDVVEIPTGVRVGNDGGRPPSRGLGEPALVDIDLNGSADLAYVGDRQGNLYRFDLADGDPSAWRAVRLFQATYAGPPARRQPITQRPFVVMHPGEGEFLVTFATGANPAGGQDADTDIQSIYGIWDPGEPDPATARPGAKSERLVRRVLENVVDEAAGSFATRRIVGGGPVRYARDGPGRIGVYGWYIDLDMPRARRTLQGLPNPDPCGRVPPGPQYPGERVAGRPVPRGRALFMVTRIPGIEQHCAAAPPGSVLTFDLHSGAGPAGGVFDLNKDGRVNAEDLVPLAGQVPVSGILLAGGAPPVTAAGPEVISRRDGSATFVLGGGDARTSLGIGGAGAPGTGRLSWREIPEVPQ